MVRRAIVRLRCAAARLRFPRRCRPTSISCATSWSTASTSPTAPAPARAACSATSSASTSAQGFPLLTTKKLHVRSIVHELLWFLRGDTNVAYLREHGVRIWDEWADPAGELGPIYGRQWRAWEGPDGEHYDQIARVIDDLRRDPHSRRHLVSAWNVADLPRMALQPCHALFQFYVAERRPLVPPLPAQRRRLPRRAVQHRRVRAAHAHDRAGVPASSRASWSSPSATCTSTATTSSRRASSSQREPRPLPVLRLNPAIEAIDDFRFEDVTVEGYQPHPAIAASVAV